MSDYERFRMSLRAREPIAIGMLAMIAAAVVGGVLLLGLAASVAYGQDAPPRPADPLAPVSAARVYPKVIHDADTISQCDIDMGWGLTLNLKHGIRAANYDACEVDYTRKTVNVTPVEIQRGKMARDELIALLNAGGQLWAEPASHQTDPYGRIDAVLWIRQPDGSWIFLAKYAEEHGWLRTPRSK
jgi:hypothetical protein